MVSSSSSCISSSLSFFSFLFHLSSSLKMKIWQIILKFLLTHRTLDRVQDLVLRNHSWEKFRKNVQLRIFEHKKKILSVFFILTFLSLCSRSRSPATRGYLLCKKKVLRPAKGGKCFLTGGEKVNFAISTWYFAKILFLLVFFCCFFFYIRGDLKIFFFSSSHLICFRSKNFELSLLNQCKLLEKLFFWTKKVLRVSYDEKKQTRENFFFDLIKGVFHELKKTEAIRHRVTI